MVLQASIDAGALTFNTKEIAMAAVAGGVGYLVKNLLTPSQIITPAKPNDPPSNP
jgi:hypothetical protein